MECTIYTLILLAVILCLGFFISIFNDHLFGHSRPQLKTPLIQTVNSDPSREAIQNNDLTSELLERANKVIANENSQVTPLIPWLGEGEKAEAYVDTIQVNLL